MPGSTSSLAGLRSILQSQPVCCSRSACPAARMRPPLRRKVTGWGTRLAEAPCKHCHEPGKPGLAWRMHAAHCDVSRTACTRTRHKQRIGTPSLENCLGQQRRCSGATNKLPHLLRFLNMVGAAPCKHCHGPGKPGPACCDVSHAHARDTSNQAWLAKPGNIFGAHAQMPWGHQ